MQAGLSFEQAPPFSVPLRFFITAPLFLFAAALLIVFSPDALTSNWTPQALALTHALTLGFLAMVMMGAMMQMLPVVAGAVLPRPRAVAWLTHVALVAGTVALMSGFLGAGMQAFSAAIVMLAIASGVFLWSSGIGLWRAVTNVTVTGMRYAWLGLVVTVSLGMALAMMLAGKTSLPESDALLAAHVIFGLLGWVLLLVVGVAYQVVPMFQITPPYPVWMTRWLAGGLFALLGLDAVTPLLPGAFQRPLILIADTGLACGVSAFALATLWLQSRRRRKLPDITLDFWRLGMVSLIACAIVWLSGQLCHRWSETHAYPLALDVLFIGGFAVSVVNGMLYKIVPFLAWFHLQAQLQARAGTIPNMKEMIPERGMRLQFRVHLAALALLLATTIRPQGVALAAGLTLGISALLLSANLLAAVHRFSSHGGRFS